MYRADDTDIWTIFPSIPQVINAFISANIVDSLLGKGPITVQWRWGFGELKIQATLLKRQQSIPS